MADLSDKVAERREHAPLVSRRCVATAYGHNRPLVQTERCRNGGKVNVVGVDSRLEK